jgi:hypothetical protein
MTKTAAELQAEAAAAAQREAEEKKAAEAQNAQGWWEWLKSFLPDFSFFNILIFGGLAAAGAYFFSQTENGKKFFDDLKGNLGNVLGSIGFNIDVSEHLAKMSIEKIRETLTEQKVPPKVIAVLAKDKPTFDAFISTLKEANGGTLGINDLKMDAIIKGPALDALLKPENRAFTVSLMVAALPADAGISKKTLTALIEHNTRNGKVTDSLRTLFAAGQDGRVQSLQEQLVNNKGEFSPVKAVEALLSPKNRAFIRALGTDNIAIIMAEKAPELSKELLDASLAFGDAIDKNPANSGANRPRTLAVLRAVARMGESVEAKEAFKGITADQLSGFFKVPGNQAAVGKLLKVVQPSLAKYWGNAEEGIAEVLASTPDSGKILRFMRGEKTWFEDVASRAGDLLGVSLETKLSYAGDKLAENAPIMAKALTLLDADAKTNTRS